jgi:hypothetical protein
MDRHVVAGQSTCGNFPIITLNVTEFGEHITALSAPKCKSRIKPVNNNKHGYENFNKLIHSFPLNC